LYITGLPFPVAQQGGLGSQTKTMIYGIKYSGGQAGPILYDIESGSPSQMTLYQTDLSTNILASNLGGGIQFHAQGYYTTTA
jgi:hypothetical protein